MSSIKTVNPANNKLIKEYQEFSPEQVQSIITKADDAYKKWKNTPIDDRSALLLKIAAILRDRKDELAGICALEMGKILQEGITEIEICAQIFEYYAIEGKKLLMDEDIKVEHGRAFIQYDPIGVILSVQPWNFPFYQLTRSAAPNIMCGNTIVIKHASNVPLAAQTMEQIFIEAGAPEGIYNNLYVPGSKISQYINNPLIKGATLTGSEAAGIDLAEIAGKNIIKSTLELGGSDPFIVMPDSDIDKAVNCAVFGRLWNAGQVCVSPKRIIIPESIAEDFISKAVTLMESIKIGDPTDPQTQLGPLSSEAALEQVLQQVETAVKQGAKLLMGGKRIITPGAFMSPAIITDITKDMDIYSHEIFGPVMMIYVVKDIDEAIAIANDSNYGLGGTVFGEDNDAAVDVARKIETGMVYINHVTGIAAQLPFGGTKRSGYGREQSVDGMYEFVNKKLIRVTTPEADY